MKKYIGEHWFLKESDDEFVFLKIEQEFESTAYCFTKMGQKWWKASDWLWNILQKGDQSYDIKKKFDQMIK